MTDEQAATAGWVARDPTRFDAVEYILTPNARHGWDTVRGSIASGRPDGRPAFDALYLAVAQVLATSGDCTRRKVGAFIVNNHIPIGMGYNGVEPGRPGCISGACPRAASDVEAYAPYTDCIAIHAEMNAIARSWAPLEGATMYVTEPPCDMCQKAIRAARIARVVVLHFQ
jgi:dCMP deaminase